MSQIITNFSTNSSTDFFEGIFENRWSKVVFIAFAILIIPIVLSLNYSIIWYEKYGQDLKRTIVNRIFSSICWTVIEFTLLVSILDLARYFFFGPLPKLFCWSQVIVKSGIILKLMLLQTGLIISRYVCIFWLKNPAAFHDDFWSFFINIWVALAGYIFQFVSVFALNQYSLMYYICIGQNPKSGPYIPFTHNYIFYGICTIIITIHIILSVKIFCYKNKMKLEVATNQSCTQKLMLLKTLEKQTLSDFTTITFSIVAVGALTMLVLRLFQVEPQELNNFPNYLIVYWIQLANAPVFIILLLTMCYARNQQMRKIMIREIKDFLRLPSTHD